MNKFVIFGFPRCGSTYLCSLLESHPKVLCHYEVFHPDEIVTVYGFHERVEEIKAYTPQSRDQNPGEFIDFLFKHNLWGEAAGFKIFIGHSEEAHRLILHDGSIKKILLRRDTIPAYTSALIANKTGAFTHKEQSQSEQVKVSLDMGGLLNFHRLIDDYFDMLKKTLDETNQPYLELDYEQLASDPATIDSVFAYIGVETGRKDIQAFTKKQNRASLADKIDNIDEVVSDSVRFWFDQYRLVESRDAEIARLKAQLAESRIAGCEREIQDSPVKEDSRDALAAESVSVSKKEM